MSSSKPFDFLSSCSVEKIIMSWTAVYPRSATSYGVINYNIRRFMTFLIQTLFAIFMTSFVIMNLNDTMKITGTLFVLISVFASLVKTCYFAMNSDNVTLLEKYISSEICYDTNDENIVMMKNDIDKTTKTMKIYMFSCLHTLVSYYTLPLFSLKKEYRLPVDCYYPWDTQPTVNYALTYLLQVTTIVISAALNTLIDTAFAKFCTMAYTELRTLKNSLENLDYSPNNSNIRSELRKNIRLHKHILKITRVIETVFNYGILIQFSASVIVICFLSYHLTWSTPDEEIDAFSQFLYLHACLIFLECMIFQVSIYCIYGHYVMAESADISQAIYLSNWYISEISIRKDLIILRERTKRPVVLTAGNIFPLNVETLVEVFRASYSVFAVLQQTE